MVDKRAPKKPAAQPNPQRAWILLAGLAVLSALGLTAAVLPALGAHLDNAWPWARTEVVLLGLFPVAVLIAVLYLSREQRRVAAMHRAVLEGRERETERIRRQNTRLAALLNVSRIMGSEIQLQNVFDSVTELCREAFECEQVSLMLVDRNTQELVVRSISGHRNPETVVGSRQKIGEGIAGHVAATGKPVFLGPGSVDESKFRSLREQSSQLSAAMVVPILVRDELVGVLNVASRKPTTTYDEADSQALAVFSTNVGSCIRHAEQAEWMRQLIHRYTANEPVTPSPGSPLSV